MIFLACVSISLHSWFVSRIWKSIFFLRSLLVHTRRIQPYEASMPTKRVVLGWESNDGGSSRDLLVLMRTLHMFSYVFISSLATCQFWRKVPPDQVAHLRYRLEGILYAFWSTPMTRAWDARTRGLGGRLAWNSRGFVRRDQVQGLWRRHSHGTMREGRKKKSKTYERVFKDPYFLALSRNPPLCLTVKIKSQYQMSARSDLQLPPYLGVESGSDTLVWHEMYTSNFIKSWWIYHIMFRSFYTPPLSNLVQEKSAVAFRCLGAQILGVYSLTLSTSHLRNPFRSQCLMHHLEGIEWLGMLFSRWYQGILFLSFLSAIKFNRLDTTQRESRTGMCTAIS